MNTRKQKVTKEDRALLKRIGGVIRAGMIDGDDTTDSLARRAGVARSTLREVIAGRSNVRLGNLLKIVRALGWGALNEFLTHVES